MPAKLLKDRPPYEALDVEGRPYLRKAQVVCELLIHDVRPALDAALPVLGQTLGLSPLKKLSFGLPVYEAFGLNHRVAGRHEHAGLLMMQACDISLDLIPCYSADVDLEKSQG